MPEPDGPQFQNLWDSAMAGAQDNLDAISDDDLAEAVDVDLSLQAMVSADLSLQDRVFARRHHASYDAAEAMENVILPPESNDMNRSGPDYSQEDPFNFMNPEEARQAKAIEDMNKMLGE